MVFKVATLKQVLHKPFLKGAPLAGVSCDFLPTASGKLFSGVSPSFSRPLSTSLRQELPRTTFYHHIWLPVAQHTAVSSTCKI